MARCPWVVLIALVIAPMVAVADPIESSRIHIVDGDTIRIDRQRPDIQLLGFDAPEIRGAKCDAEIDLGAKAARRLRVLLREGHLDFSFTRCPCPTGKEGTAYCQRGRRCGVLKSRGHNVGDVLIAEKLAIPLVCDETRCPVSPEPWCRH
jgi:endonuclease YncB( thermonuclease family)